MSTPWWQLGSSQTYGVNGEQGIDIKTPFHTPITNLYPGQVVEAQYGSAGGIVGVLTQVPGLGRVVEYFLHLDLINVGVGQQIGIGQQVGISGGENADPRLPGYVAGGLHPASPQFSSGPHTEFGFFRGTPFASANAGDPIGYLHPANGSTVTATSAPVTGVGSAPADPNRPPFCDWPIVGFFVCGPGDLGQAAGQAVGKQIFNGSDPLSQFLNLIGPGLATSLENLGFFILALVFILIGLALVAYEPGQGGVGKTVRGAFSA